MDNGPPKSPGEKTLHVWSKPMDPKDQAQAQQDGADAAPPGGPRLKDAVAMIKKEDFLNVAKTPCARQGYLTGIASGVGIGALRFIIRGNPGKAANWAVVTFVLGSTVSYEVCQYNRRRERAQMNRSIEVVTAGRKEKAQKAAEASRIAAEESRNAAEESRTMAEAIKREAEERQRQLRLEQERISAARKPWYRVW